MKAQQTPSPRQAAGQRQVRRATAAILVGIGAALAIGQAATPADEDTAQTPGSEDGGSQDDRAEVEIVNEYDQSAAAAAYARTQGKSPSEAQEEGGDEAAQSGEPSDADAVAALLEENKSLREQVLRTHAEMDNLRKRTAREKEDGAKFAISRFAKDLLTVADNLQRAAQAIPEGAGSDNPLLQTLADGVAAVERELATVLERHGVRKVEAEGAPFDANLHEAVMEQPTPDIAPGHVAQVFQTGYTLNDRLLRPAMVAVAKAP